MFFDKKRILKNIRGTLWISVAALVSFLQSCVVENNDCEPDDLQPGETAFVQFRLNTGDSHNGNTRATGDSSFDSENHEAEEGLAAENYISLDDMKIFIFNTKTGKLIEELRPIPTLNDPMVVTAELTVRDHLIADDKGNVNLSLVVLANWNSIGRDYPALYINEATLDDLETSKNYVFTQSATWAPSYDVNTRKGNGIPMYGRQDYSGFTLDLIKASSKENPLKLYPQPGAAPKSYEKDVQLLRSLAKIEIADNISFRVNGYPKIESVKIKNYRSNGLLVPLPEAFKNGYNQVFKVSLPNTAEYSEKLMTKRAAYKTGITDPLDEWQQKFPGGWFSTYIPEMSYNPEVNNFVMEVGIRTGAGANDIITRTAAIPGFKVTGSNEEGTILRNHIYRIEVDLDIQDPMKLTLFYGICPWIEETIDIPKFD